MPERRKQGKVMSCAFQYEALWVTLMLNMLEMEQNASKES